MTSQGPCKKCGRVTGYYSYEEPKGWYCGTQDGGCGYISDNEAVTIQADNAPPPKYLLNRKARRARIKRARMRD